MVGKKSGKALLREEGLERTDNNMELTSWPQIMAINQKNYYTDYLKRDEQILAFRSQQEEARIKMIKQARDRDRALAQGKAVGPDGDIEMEEGEEGAEDEASSGTKTIVIHIGSQNLRVGLASDALPKTVPMVIARRAPLSESEEGDGEPAPKRAKLDNGLPPPEPEKRFGEDFAKKFSGMSNELKMRMRMNKRKVLPQSRDMVTSYNRRSTYETITEHNDTMRIEWTDTSGGEKGVPAYITGKAALRIPDQSTPRYKLHWPIRLGWINERDYDSKRLLWEDIRIIIEDAIKSQLDIKIRTRADWSQYSCVIVIPDYYERTYVSSLLNMAITEFGFAKVCFIQESLAASFGAGFTTCCIVDIGAQKTSIACVEDGMVIDNSRVNLKYGGRDITDAFVKMIIYNHFPYSEINLNRRYDFQLAEELKQKFCTMNEADISVQLYDFHLRAPGQDTRKYTFKIYDEVILAPTGLFKPEIFDHSGKLDGRRKLVDKSYDIYDGKPNDPSSSAQAEILTIIAPEEVLSSTTKSNAKSNGLPNGVKEEVINGSRRPSFSNIKEMDATPQPSTASSPARNLDGTPQPDDNGVAPQKDEKPKAEEEPEEEPVSIERRDDLLPIYPLHKAVLASVTHAARGSPQKTSDLLSGIMVIGGTSIIPGLAQYLEDTLKGEQPDYGKDILIGRPPRELDPQVVVWKGGAVFGRMSRTNDSWINGFLYERLGDRVLAHKLMWAW
ncbi:putative actin-related protein 8 [Exophiala dermatitidis]